MPVVALTHAGGNDAPSASRTGLGFATLTRGWADEPAGPTNDHGQLRSFVRPHRPCDSVRSTPERPPARWGLLTDRDFRLLFLGGAGQQVRQ